MERGPDIGEVEMVVMRVGVSRLGSGLRRCRAGSGNEDSVGQGPVIEGALEIQIPD